jgi:hypothetical protein
MMHSESFWALFMEDNIVVSSLLLIFFVLAARAGIFKQAMGARNRVGIGLSYRPARLHRLAELIPWN